MDIRNLTPEQTKAYVHLMLLKTEKAFEIKRVLDEYEAQRNADVLAYLAQITPIKMPKRIRRIGS